MKRRALMLGLVLVVGCGGGSTEPDGDNPPPGSVKVFTATVNGTSFTGVNVAGVYSNGTLSITAQDAQARIFSFSAQNLSGAQTFTLAPGNQWNALVQMIDPGVGQFSTGFLGGSGTVTLTTATTGRIVGTFSLIAYTSAGTGVGNRVITVQNGMFDISHP